MEQHQHNKKVGIDAPHVVESVALLLEHKVVVSATGTLVSLPHLHELNLSTGR